MYSYVEPVVEMFCTDGTAGGLFCVHFRDVSLDSLCTYGAHIAVAVDDERIHCFGFVTTF